MLVIILKVGSKPIATDAIARGSQWQYLDNGTDQGTQWVATNFDDTAWKSGLAPLGYGFSNIKTTVSYG